MIFTNRYNAAFVFCFVKDIRNNRFQYSALHQIIQKSRFLRVSHLFCICNVANNPLFSTHKLCNVALFVLNRVKQDIQHFQHSVINANRYIMQIFPSFHIRFCIRRYCNVALFESWKTAYSMDISTRHHVQLLQELCYGFSISHSISKHTFTIFSIWEKWSETPFSLFIFICFASASIIVLHNSRRKHMFVS